MKRMKRFIFLANFRRAFTEPNFYLTVLLTAVVLLPIAANTRMYSNALEGIVSVLNGSGVFSIVICMLPALPFAGSYAQDENSGMLNFWAIRSGTRAYAGSQYLFSVLMGFCATFAGMLLCFFCILAGGTPFWDGMSGDGGGYSVLLGEGKLVLYLFMNLTNLALSSAIMAGVAAWFGSLVPNRMAVLAAPLVLYILLLRLIPSGTVPPYLDPGSILQGEVTMATPWATLGVKALIALIICGILGFFAVMNIQRRQKHA